MTLSMEGALHAFLSGNFAVRTYWKISRVTRESPELKKTPRSCRKFSFKSSFGCFGIFWLLLLLYSILNDGTGGAVGFPVGGFVLGLLVLKAYVGFVVGGGKVGGFVGAFVGGGKVGGFVGAFVGGGKVGGFVGAFVSGGKVGGLVGTGVARIGIVTSGIVSPSK